MFAIQPVPSSLSTTRYHSYIHRAHKLPILLCSHRPHNLITISVRETRSCTVPAIKARIYCHIRLLVFTAAVSYSLCGRTMISTALGAHVAIMFLIFPSVDSRCQIQGEACYPVDVHCVNGIGTATPGTAVVLSATVVSMSFDIGSHISAGCVGFKTRHSSRSRPRLSDSCT
jgi:hypothetical protein